MERDIRDTPFYKEIEEHFRRIHEPSFGRISGATELDPSPNGRRIAFTGERLDRLEGKAASRVGIADVGTGTVEEATAGPNDDRLPRWSPDGARLAFLSDRSEKDRFQPYVLERDRVGEAVPLPEVPGTVEFHRWSPNGSRLLLGVAGLGADQAGAQGSGTIRAGGGDLPSWIPEVESASNVEREWRTLWVLDVEGRTVVRLSREGLNVWEAAWCGNDAVAAIASESPGEEAWYAAPLVLIDEATGTERALYRSEVQLGLPCASPDGGRVAVVEALCSDRMIVAGDILLVDADGGAPQRVDAGGADVTHIAWRDEGRLFFMGLRGLETVGGELDARTGDVTELWRSSESCGDWYPSGVPMGSDAFAVVLESYDRPPEIAVVRDGKPETVHSFAHEGTRYLQEIGGRMEAVSWTAPDGLEIQGLLLVPESAGPHPLIVQVHGGPVWAYQNRFFRPLTPLLVSRGYAALLPNPRGSTGRGREFAEMVVGDMGGGDALDVLAGIDALIERGIADPGRVGVTGGSYGGFMSCWLPTQTDRFTAAVAISPVTDWYSQHFNSNIGHWDGDFLGGRPSSPGGPYLERSPVMLADRIKTPTLLTAGLQDRCTPPGQAIEFYRALREHGVETEVVLYPDEGHGVRKMPASIDLCTRTVEWFERHMPPRAG